MHEHLRPLRTRKETVTLGTRFYEVAEALVTNVAAEAVKAAKIGAVMVRAKSLVLKAIDIVKLPVGSGRGAKGAAAKATSAIEAAGEKLTKVVLTILNNTCFAAGTPVMTPDGDRLIETLKPGDLVWSRPEHLPDAPLKIRRIEQVFELEGSIVELHIGGQVIKTTGEHPFYVEGLGWTPTFELTEGQRLIGHNGKTMPVERIVLTEQSSTVYNLRIAEDHTYFGGQDDWDFSVWVHNAYNVKAVENGFEIFEDGVSRSIKNREDFDLFYKLGKITKQQYDDALAAAAKIAKKEAPKTGPLRSRMGNPPAAMKNPQAHHDLPQAFRQKFEKAGLDIENPAFGRWVEGSPQGTHQNWSRAFNNEWQAFFDRFPAGTMPTQQQILDFMNGLRNSGRFQ